METEFVACPDHLWEVKQEVADDGYIKEEEGHLVDPLSLVNTELQDQVLRKGSSMHPLVLKENKIPPVWTIRPISMDGFGTKIKSVQNIQDSQFYRSELPVQKRSLLPEDSEKLEKESSTPNNKIIPESHPPTLNISDNSFTDVHCSLDSKNSLSITNLKGVILQKRRNPNQMSITITDEERKAFKIHNDTTCHVCNITFFDNELLLKHLSENRFICRVCVTEFDSHSDLASHFIRHRGKKCLSCNEIFFYQRNQFQHVRCNPSCAEEAERFVCKICKVSLLSEKILEHHVLKNHPNGEEKLECVVCKNTFSCRLRLNYHLKNTHVPFEYLACNMCDRLCDGPKKLKGHIQRCHSTNREHFLGNCKICKKVFTNENGLKEHLKRHDETESLCRLCGKTIKGGPIGMTTHLYLKHPKKPFTCKICLEQFSTRCKLKYHRAKMHKNKAQNQDQPQCCEICGNTFKSLNILRKHYEIHSDERKYKCEICGASFKQLVALRTHGRIHSGVLKYTCDKCGKAFRWKQTSDKHSAKCTGSRRNSESDLADDETEN